MKQTESGLSTRVTPTILSAVVGVTLLLAAVCAAQSAAAQEAPERSAAEVAAELANPNSLLGTLNFNLDFQTYDGTLPGAGDQDGFTLGFQPVLPYPLKSGVNLFVRPLIPIVFRQPVPTADGFEDVGTDLGDISFDVAVGKTLTSGMVLVGGVVGTTPTATSDALGLDQWLLGPEALVAVVKPWGALGMLVTHQWDIAGEDSFDTSVTGGQYFVVLNLGEGWQFNSSPTFSYNHEAESGQRWTLPLSAGVSRTTLIGRTPWKFNVSYWHYLETPDAFGPDQQIRLTISPVIPLPWGK